MKITLGFSRMGAAARGARLLGLALGLAGALSACGDEATDSGTGTGGELSLGASGPQVSDAYRYLMDAGYFPNEKLAARYPQWRPIVADLPARTDVLDATMARALRKLQGNRGLQRTGTLNQETLEEIARPRCTFPDDDPDRAANVDKWALVTEAARWTKTNITFRFTSNTALYGNYQQTQALITNGFKAWEAHTNLTFTATSGAADVLINFASIANPGSTSPPPNGSVTFDTTGQTWTPISLTSTAIHEWGHILGLHHTSNGSSTIGYPMMWGGYTGNTTFKDDDIAPVNALYNDWTKLSGTAIDIGASGLAGTYSGEVVWSIAPNGTPQRWNGSGWTAVPGVAATRVDVDNVGFAWIVGPSGRVFRGNGSGWTEVPGGGRVKDIGCGGGAVWGIGTDGRAYSYNQLYGVWNFSGGPLNQISIDVTSSGQPWVVTSANEVHVLASAWTFYMSGIGNDIGLGGYKSGPANYPYYWVLGTNSTIYLHGSQASGSVGDPLPPAWWGFIATNGMGRRITAGNHGRIWVAATDNSIWVRNEIPQ
jgi:hypothetical protein